MVWCVGGGVVDGLFDSIDIEPRVRFGVLFGVSSAAILAAIFFSISFWGALPGFGNGVLMVFVPPLPVNVLDKLLLFEMLLLALFVDAGAATPVTDVDAFVFIEEAPDSIFVCWWAAAALFDFDANDDNDNDFDCELFIDCDWVTAEDPDDVDDDDEDDGFELVPLETVLMELDCGCGVDVRAINIYIIIKEKQ